MDERVTTTSFVATVVLTLSAVAASASPAQDHGNARIDSIVSAEMEREGIPGVAVPVVKNGKVLLAKEYGDANVDHHVADGVETVFQATPWASGSGTIGYTSRSDIPLK